MNVGIHQAASPLFDLGIAPILVTQLLKVVEWFIAERACKSTTGRVNEHDVEDHAGAAR
jgi:hypothetical protein